MPFITFTADVGRISTASNVDGSIRWHIYERPFGNGTSIFVRREVSGVLEAEVRLFNEGERPEIFFNPATSQWLIFYTLNENAFLVTADENDTPTTQPPQIGTTRDQLRPGGSAPRSEQTLAQQNDNEFLIGLSLGVYDGPRRVVEFAIGASKTPLTSLIVRWRAVPTTAANQNLNVAGFRVFRQAFTGGITDITPGGLTAVQPFSDDYEVEVPLNNGVYYVTQVNFRGDATTALVESRLRPPGSRLLSSGRADGDVLDRFEIRGGSPRESQDLNLAIIGAAPVQILRDDVFRIAGGESFRTLEIPVVDFQELVVATPTDGLAVRGGDGFNALLTIVGQGSVIVG